MKPALVNCRYCKDKTENTGTCVCSKCRKTLAYYSHTSEKEMQEIFKEIKNLKYKKQKTTIFNNQDVYCGDFYRE